MDSQDRRTECAPEGAAEVVHGPLEARGSDGATAATVVSVRRRRAAKPRLRFPEDDGFHLFRIH